MGPGHCPDHTPAVPQEPAQDRLLSSVSETKLVSRGTVFHSGSVGRMQKQEVRHTLHLETPAPGRYRQIVVVEQAGQFELLIFEGSRPSVI